MSKIVVNNNVISAAFLKINYKKDGIVYGDGIIEFADGSLYKGNMVYDGIDYYKNGYGVLDFSNSRMIGENVGGPVDSKINKYIGFFDYSKDEWQYGKGVFYFNDLNGNPLAFIKGFFTHNQCIDKYDDFNYDDLIEGYNKDMEINQQKGIEALVNRIIAHYPYKNNYKYLFMGDSYFEFWREHKNKLGKTFDDDFASYEVLNVGIGGTKYRNWFTLIDRLVIPYNPKYIFLNFGQNDFYAKLSCEEIVNDMVKLTSMIKEKLPNVKFIIFGICHTPLKKDQIEQEKLLNKREYEYTLLHDDYTFINPNEKINFEILSEYFVSDHLHPSRKLYDIFKELSLDYIKKH